MFRNLRIFALLSGLLVLSFISKAQDPVFSQFYASGLYLNPAMAGVEPNWALSMNYRNQWSVVATDPYVTSQASFIIPFYKKNESQRHWGGTGISVFNDHAGAGFLSTTGANASIAYNVPVSKIHSVLLSVQLGIINKSVNNDFTWGSNYDPNAPGGLNTGTGGTSVNLISNKIFPDAGAGIMYYFNAGRNYAEKGFSAYMGFAANHLNEPDESIMQGEKSKLPILAKAHAGFEVSISPRINFSPNAIYALQDKDDQLNAGAYFTYQFSFKESVLVPNAFILGGWYRLEDAVIASIGFSNSYYTLGFSYDSNEENLGNITNGRGAYEISLKITKPRPGRTVRFYTPRI